MHYCSVCPNHSEDENDSIKSKWFHLNYATFYDVSVFF